MKKIRKLTFALAAIMMVAFGFGALSLSYADQTVSTIENFNVIEKSQIRTSDPEGLRFLAEISEDAYNGLTDVTEIGMVLAPQSFIDGELTLDTADALKIPTTIWIQNYGTAGYKAYNSVLAAEEGESEFPAEFYNVPISARAYVKYDTDKVAYSANTVTRSIGYVAAITELSGGNGSDSATVTKIAAAVTKEIAIDDTLDIQNATNGYGVKLLIGGVEAKSSEYTVEWSVTGGTVSVADGVATPLKGGKSTITAKVVYGDDQTKTLSVSKEVNVSIPTVSESESYFAIKATDDDGEIVVNDYSYTLSDANVVSVVLDGSTLTADQDYTVEGSVITVNGASFANAVSASAKTLTITTDTNKVEVEFGKIANFVVTKASDMNSGSEATHSPMVLATCEDSSVDKVKWGGYIILANDIDFDGATLLNKSLAYNAYGGSNWGFIGHFDGQGHTLKNLNMWVVNSSLFGRVDFGSIIENTNFMGFRFNRYNAFGLFDFCCGTVRNVVVDATSDRDGCYMLGQFYSYNSGSENVGAKLLNSTVYARVGAATETSKNCVMASDSTFVSTEGTKIYTQYSVPAAFATAGGTVEKLQPGEYHALKINDPTNDVGSGDVIDNAFVKTGLEGALQSVTLYGTNNNEQWLEKNAITGATLVEGTLTIPVSSLNSYLGRGIAIQVKTDADTYWYYQDIVTYAITSAADVYASDIEGLEKHNYIPRFAKAGGATTGYDTTAVTSNHTGYFILANDIDFDGASVISMLYTKYAAGSPDYGLIGTIDGRGYAMKNFVLDYRGWGWHSMLGNVTKYGTIKNIGFINYTTRDLVPESDNTYVRGGCNLGLFYSCGKTDNIYVDCTVNDDTPALVCYIEYVYNPEPTFTNSTVIVRGTTDSQNVKVFGAFGASSDGTVVYTDLPAANINFNGTVKPLSELPS